MAATHSQVMRTVRSYDQVRFPFARRVGELFDGAELSRLDDVCDVYPADGGSDQATDAHRRFYAGFGQLESLYHDFLRTEILPVFTGSLCVQMVPTFRVSPPGGTAVKEFHRDADYNHQTGTVNFWLPLTPAFDTNTIWLETKPGLADYGPVAVSPGEYLQFDAVRLRHGNVQNLTGSCRVSFDFRVIPTRSFRDRGLSTVTSGIRMGIGAYYMMMENAPLATSFGN